MGTHPAGQLSRYGSFDGREKEDDATPHADQPSYEGPQPGDLTLLGLDPEVLLELAPDAILIVDDHGVIQVVNERAEQIFGYSRAELIGQPVELLVPEGQKELHVEHRRRYMTRPKARPMGVGLDLTAIAKDGKEFPVEISLSPVSTDDRLMIISVVRDVSSRRRLQEAALTARAIAAQEGERVRIARDLHDEVAQALSGIALGLEQIASAPQLEAARDEAKQLGGEVTNAMREFRRVLEHLRPDELANIGLTASLQRMAEERRESTPDITIVFRSHGNGRRLDPDTELAAYRVVQEAVTNAVNHANPNTIEIDLTATEDAMTATVRDDGCGFDVEQTPEDGLGLGGMRERARLIGSKLKIDSAAGRGTEVTLRLPVRPR
jgi:PAS domain S-box-containing protein